MAMQLLRFDGLQHVNYRIIVLLSQPPKFEKNWNVPALQAIDYCLWSLQRLFERGEERYLELLWPVFRLVIDMDDTRTAQYGTNYTQKQPLI